jgi:hypothetical protein
LTSCVRSSDNSRKSTLRIPHTVVTVAGRYSRRTAAIRGGSEELFAQVHERCDYGVQDQYEAHIAPFIGIKAVDMAINAVGLV